MNPLLKTVAYRLSLGLLTLVLVSIIIFSAVEMLPGDFARAILGQAATPETVAAFQREIGLDRPPIQRYLRWVGNVVRGDFGQSFASRVGYRRTVASLVAPRLHNTLFLAAMTALLPVPLSLGLAIPTALYRNSWFDRAVNAITLTTISLPEFLIAYVLMLFLAVRPPIFYSLATVSPDTPLLERLGRSVL